MEVIWIICFFIFVYIVGMIANGVSAAQSLSQQRLNNKIAKEELKLKKLEYEISKKRAVKDEIIAEKRNPNRSVSKLNVESSEHEDIASKDGKEIASA